MAILITGGAGYIGSHTCVELLEEGYDLVVVDNLVNSKKEVIDRIEQISNKKVKFYQIDILNEKDLEKVFKENDIEAVIHFAGLKAVGESVTVPLKYYHNNIIGTLILCKVMQKYNVRNIVFSSSATVYGENNISPLSEDLPTSATNPYGRTKLMIEEILKDLYISDKSWAISILRYFNPVGAHESSLIGEEPNGIPNNLMPYITQVALRKRDKLNVFGNTYDTHDGTGVRDYIHVVDLAKGHIKALEKILSSNGVLIYNLGTGRGYSVLDLVTTFEKVNNVKVPYKITEKRAGDIGTCYANPNRAFEELGWKAVKSLEDMCRDSYTWEKKNI